MSRFDKHPYLQWALYALALALFLLLLQWMEFRFLVVDHATEIYITLIAIVFTVFGIWLARKLTAPKTTVVEKEVVIYRNSSDGFVRNEQVIESLALSTREMEVLQLMAEGCSNQEIADRLFVSLHTVKTHSSKLFEKLDVKRRTQAIETARRLSIIP